MKKSTTRQFKSLFIIASLLFSSHNLFASHILGADISYKWISDSTYRITLALYGDCTSVSGSYQTLPTARPLICILDSITSVGTISLTLDTPYCGRDVSPVCPGDTTRCQSMTAIFPGINKFTYSGTYTLPHSSRTWIFSYIGNNGSTPATYSCPGTIIGSGTSSPASAGRSAAITNLTSAGATILTVSTGLNSTIGHNSSVNLTVAQQTYFCNNAHNFYNPGASDPDADSFYVSLIPALNVAGATCGSAVSIAPYSGSAWPGTPISATKPLNVLADSFVLNPLTGSLTFHPNALQRSIVIYNIDEYRSGVKVGFSQREMTVLATTCGFGFPCGTGLISLSVPEADMVNGIKIYPNPANDVLTIKTDKNNCQSFTILNSVGQVVKHQEMNATITDVNIHNLNPGLYVIQIKDINGSVTTRNFVKK